MNDMRGTDMVILGILAWLLWKEYNPESVTLDTSAGIGSNGGVLKNGVIRNGVTCFPGGTAILREPISSISGPAWTRNPA